MVEHLRPSQLTVAHLCQLLDVSKSGYYAWRRRQQTPARRQCDNEALSSRIATLFRSHHGCYGSPRITAALQKQGLVVGHNRVARLMRQAGLCAVRVRQRRVATPCDSVAEASSNLLNRNFAATAPDQKWVADATYLPTRQGWLYLAVVVDLFSRKVVGWASQPRFGQELVCAALQNALATRRSPQMHHSDRGVQYRSIRYLGLLQQHAIQSSMSRPGQCRDNAVVESFFATLKAELLPPTSACSQAEVEDALLHYIDGYYNRERCHSTLGNLSPEAFEQAYQAQPQPSALPHNPTPLVPV